MKKIDLDEDTKKGLKVLGIAAGVGILGYVAYKIINSGSKKDKSKEPQQVTTTIPTTTTVTTTVPSTVVPSSSADEQISSDISAWKTYEGSNLGIRFKYPPQFGDPKLSRYDFIQANFLSVSYGNEEALFTFTIEEKVTNALEPFVESTLQLVEFTSPMRVITKQNRTVAGVPAIEVEIEMKDPKSNQPIRIWFLFFFGDSLVYCLKFQKKKGQEKIFEIVQQLSSTIEMLSIPTTGKVDFYGKKYNLQIRLPYLSMIASNNNDNEYILLDASTGGSNSINMNLNLNGLRILEQETSFDSLESFTSHRSSLLPSSTKVSSLEGLQLLSLQQEQYTVLTYEEVVEEKPCQFVEVLFLLEGMAFIVIGYCEPSQYSSFVTLFKQSLSSLQFDVHSSNTKEKSVSVYTNREYGFSISAELGCQIVQFAVGDTIVCLSSLQVSEREEEEIIFAETRVSVTSKLPNVQTAQELKDYLKAEVERDGKFDLQVRSAEVVKMNDMDAVKILYTQYDAQNEQLVLFITTSILHENKIYSISSHTYEKMYTKETEMTITARHQSFTLV